MSRELIDAYERIRHRIVEVRAMLRELKKEEQYIIQEITNTLTQSDQVGFRLDDGSIVTVVDHTKRTCRSGKDYTDYVKEVIGNTFGVQDDNVVSKIVEGKVKSKENVKRLKIIKTK